MVAGYKVFKVNCLHSVLVMIVVVSCSHEYFLTINASSRNRKFAVIVHCSCTLKSQVEPYYTCDLNKFSGMVLLVTSTYDYNELRLQMISFLMSDL